MLRPVGKDPLLIEEPKQTIRNTNIIFFPLDAVQITCSLFIKKEKKKTERANKLSALKYYK